MTKRSLAVAAAITIGAAGLWWTTTLAFDPQPDPPAFRVISVRPGEMIQVHAFCASHPAAGIAPRACAGQLMIHTSDGEMVAAQDVRLKPGKAATLEYTNRSTTGERVGITPCINPNPLSGKLVPTAQLIAETGETVLVLNPVAPRLPFIKDAMER